MLQSSLADTNKQLDNANKDLARYERDYMNLKKELEACNNSKAKVESERESIKSQIKIREEQIADLRQQLVDAKNIRDKQLNQVEDLTNLSTKVNDNIKETLSQLGEKDKYIRYLQAAKSRADSINLALAVNLKSVLKDGIEDEDIEVKVDKTVVFVNLSDRMLFNSGSATLSPRAKEVLSKIATIVKSRPELEVMVEGYTDNVPIKRDCFKDNWDLSVIRSTAVVRMLQDEYKIDPNRLIAAGRGEYNALASNDTPDGRAMNRRTRIIILPKLDQFYDLLNPQNVPK